MSTSQPVAVQPRAYRDALLAFPGSYAFHDEIPIPYGSQEPYEISTKLGYGKYSDVFEGYDSTRGVPVVIKILKPVRRKKIYREVKVLTNVLGGPNCISLLDVVGVAGSDYPALVMEYGGASLAAVYSGLGLTDLKLVTLETLRTLEWCHQRGIVHRDIKPGNMCYSRATGTLKVLDFGLAEFYRYGSALHHRVASRHFKSPELLVNYQLYDYSLDIWSLGASLAGLLFKRNPFFKGTNNTNQLDKIVEVLGSPGFFAFLSKYNIHIPSARAKELQGYGGVPLESFINGENRAFVSEEAIDFLRKILVYDPAARPTALELMQHPWLDSVRDRVAASALEEIRARKRLVEECRRVEAQAGQSGQSTGVAAATAEAAADAVSGPAGVSRADSPAFAASAVSVASPVSSTCASAQPGAVESPAATSSSSQGSPAAPLPDETDLAGYLAKSRDSLQLCGIVGLQPAALPSWILPGQGKAPVTFPIPASPAQISKNPAKYGAVEEEWRAYWTDFQNSLVQQGMRYYRLATAKLYRDAKVD